MNLYILPEADDDVDAAAYWYDDQQYGLSDAFVTEWRRLLTRICDDPGHHPLEEHYTGKLEVRRCRFQGFPYNVVFICFPDVVVVVSVAHSSRRPLYWLDRLPPD